MDRIAKLKYTWGKPKEMDPKPLKRTTEMTPEEQLAHCEKTLKRCTKYDSLAANFLNAKIKSLKKQIANEA